MVVAAAVAVVFAADFLILGRFLSGAAGIAFAFAVVAAGAADVLVVGAADVVAVIAVVSVNVVLAAVILVVVVVMPFDGAVLVQQPSN